MSWRRGRAYGQDLRDRFLPCGDVTLVQVATRFGVSPPMSRKCGPGFAIWAMPTLACSAATCPCACPAIPTRFRRRSRHLRTPH